MKFEDRSQEETERQQRCARSKAWSLAKNIYKLREKYKATMRELKQAQWLRVAGDEVVMKGHKEFAINGKQEGSVREETMAVSGTTVMSVQNQKPKTTPSSELPTQRGRSASRERTLRGRSPSGKSIRQPCKDFLKGICTKLPCDSWHPPECQFEKSESGCNFCNWCSFPHRKVEEQPNKKAEKGGDKSAVVFLKDVRELGCVFQETEPPESLSISRNGTKVLGPIRRVRFTKATQRHADIRENKGPSLGKRQVKFPHQRSPNAMKFEDRSQEEIARQERCARGDAWRMAKNILKLKETDKAVFFSPTNEWRKVNLL